MNVIQSLRALSLYPINPATVENIAQDCQLDGTADASTEVRNSVGYRKAKALILQYLSEAPTIKEAGAEYSFTDEQKEQFRLRAAKLFSEIGEGDSQTEVGYFGEDF